MKTFVVVLIVIFLAFAGYAWTKDPQQCRLIGKDFVALYNSLLPGAAATIPLPPQGAPAPVAPPAPVSSAPLAPNNIQTNNVALPTLPDPLQTNTLAFPSSTN